MSKGEIGSLDLFRALVGSFGPGRAAAIVGYCVLFAVAGAESRRDILAADVGSIETRYRVLADIRRFRAALVEKGYRLRADEEVGQYEMAMALGRGELAA